MWIGLLAAWVLGSIALYVYLVRTAREPVNQECMDCNALDCAECPLLAEQEEAPPLRRAA